MLLRFRENIFFDESSGIIAEVDTKPPLYPPSVYNYNFKHTSDRKRE